MSCTFFILVSSVPIVSHITVVLYLKYTIVYTILHHKLLVVMKGMGLMTPPQQAANQEGFVKIGRLMQDHRTLWHGRPLGTDGVKKDGGDAGAVVSIDNNQDIGCQYMYGFVSRLRGYTIILRRC